MVRLDHFVINIDNDMEKLKDLKKQIEPRGFPFEPTWGKGTKGFKVANIWIGLQYLEMVWLKKKDGGGWKADWVEKYNRGHRGVIAIYLMTDQLDEIREELKRRGIPVSEPERVSFRCFFGLFKKTMPWRSIFTAPIPGTDLEICFGDLDHPEIMEKMKAYMVPSAPRAVAMLVGVYTFLVSKIQLNKRMLPLFLARRYIGMNRLQSLPRELIMEFGCIKCPGKAICTS